MASSEGRRTFLLGITLNELSFIMFFLLMITSASVLQKTKQQLEQQTQNNISMLAQAQDDEVAFKRLQLLESRLMQIGGFATKPSEQQLDELFSRLQEAKADASLRQANTRLQSEVDALQSYKGLAEALERNNIQQNSAQKMVEQLLQQAETSQKEQQLLQGRVAYMQKKLKGTGLDHPPCWANPKTGAVEYLYSITLYEQKIKIAAAWPEYRKADVHRIPGAEKLAGKRLTQQQFQQQVAPIFAWSKAHECRHFVRIKDDKQTSKKAFKRQMLAVETYFYKYLQR